MIFDGTLVLNLSNSLTSQHPVSFSTVLEFRANTLRAPLFYDLRSFPPASNVSLDGGIHRSIQVFMYDNMVKCSTDHR